MSAQHVEDIDKPGVVIEVNPLNKNMTDDSMAHEAQDFMDKFLDMSENAKDNDRKEKYMPLKEGLKTFPKAAMWSVILSTALIMEGYDTNLLNSLYAFPDFAKKFGEYSESDGLYQIPAKWQTSLSMCVNVGEIIGLFIAGIIADRIGYRKTLIGALMLTTGFIFIVFFAVNVEMLLAGELLLGLPWGAFQTLTVSYASEVCPTTLRVYLTTYVNVCWVFGQLISSGILRGLVSSDIEDVYRIPFAVQWVWPIPIAIGIYLAPESPWWLARKNRIQEAKHSIKRLLTVNEHLPDKEILAEAMVQKIQMTLKEEALTNNGESFLDCFKGQDLRRTRIAAIVWVSQNLTGSSLMGYSTYFYQQAGLGQNMSFTFSIIQYCFGIVGTLGSWLLSQKAGRFTIYFYGLCSLFCILFVVGCLGINPTESSSWGVGSLLLVYTFVYDLTIGPLCYCIVAEIPSTKLRTKTIIIARNAYNIAGIVVAVITPYMLNPTAWNWKAKTGFFWSGFAFFAAIWCWFDLPETKGKTFAELDQLFENKVKARQFKKTEVEVFNTDELIERLGEDGIKDLVVTDASKDEFSEKV